MNPFVLGNILPGDAFCNRQQEIEELTRHVLNCTNVVVYSKRRYGKTSLVRQIMSGVTRKKFLAVYTDLFSVSSEDDFIQKWISSIVRSVGKNVTVQSLDRIKRIFTRIIPLIELKPDGISISARYDNTVGLPYLIEDIFDGLNKYLTSKKLKGFIVFDEFQEITELKESRKIEGILREHIQAQRNKAFFFVGSRRRTLKAMFTDSKRPFFKSAFSYPIDKIPESELVDFIYKQFKTSGKVCPENVAAEVYNYVDGNTYYVQKLSHLLWDITKKKATIDLLKRAEQKLGQIEAMDFQGVFSGLTQGEKRTLKALAKEPTRAPYSSDYMGRHYLSIGGVQKSLKSLMDKDIVEMSEDGRYQLSDSLFARWCN